MEARKKYSLVAGRYCWLRMFRAESERAVVKVPKGVVVGSVTDGTWLVCVAEP